MCHNSLDDRHSQFTRAYTFETITGGKKTLIGRFMALDFDELDTGLADIEAGTRAAECHGFITGYVCASNNTVTAPIRDHLVGGIDNAGQLEQAYALLDLIAADVIASLQTTEIIFQPLLPDDSADMSHRAASLSEWCAGFISGLGVGGLGEKQSQHPDCDEFIKDIVSISRLETDASDDEDAESSLFELVEYIRVGVLMLYQEWYPDAEIVQRPEVLH